MNMKFNDKLRTLIEENDFTQKKVAQELKIAPSTLGGYVQGTSEHDFETLKQIAVYFNVSTDYLLDIPETHTKDSTENELLRIFRTLSSEQKSIFIEQGKAFVRVNNMNKDKARS